MVREIVDFHVHYDDASASKILDTAKEKGVVAIALVGRGELSSSFDKHHQQGLERGVHVFSGVEYLARINDKFVDLIAIGFDTENKDVRHYFGIEEGRQKNAEVAEKQKNFLESQGYTFEGLSEKDKEDLGHLLRGDIYEKAIRFCRLVINNSANGSLVNVTKAANLSKWSEVVSKYSQKPGYIDDTKALDAKFLYTIYFAPGQPGCIPVQSRAREIIDTMHRAGGVVLYSPEGKFDDGVWEELKKMDIDGVMGWHAGQIEIPQGIVREAIKSHLLVLGGSDYHPQKNHWQVGVGEGNMHINARRYKELLEKLEQRKTAAEK